MRDFLKEQIEKERFEISNIVNKIEELKLIIENEKKDNLKETYNVKINGEKQRAYSRNYYKRNREEILKRMKENYEYDEEKKKKRHDNYIKRKELYKLKNREKYLKGEI